MVLLKAEVNQKLLEKYQESLNSLALLSTENDRVQEINFNYVIDEFVSLKVRKQVF